MMRRSRKLEGWSQALSFYCILYMFVEDKMVRWLIEVKNGKEYGSKLYVEKKQISADENDGPSKSCREI